LMAQGRRLGLWLLVQYFPLNWIEFIFGGPHHMQSTEPGVVPSGPNFWSPTTPNSSKVTQLWVWASVILTSSPHSPSTEPSLHCPALWWVHPACPLLKGKTWFPLVEHGLREENYLSCYKVTGSALCFAIWPHYLMLN
jgi:hypothetical protein